MTTSHREESFSKPSLPSTTEGQRAVTLLQALARRVLVLCFLLQTFFFKSQRPSWQELSEYWVHRVFVDPSNPPKLKA
jgi:hypothetical protein